MPPRLEWRQARLNSRALETLHVDKALPPLGKPWTCVTAARPKSSTGPRDYWGFHAPRPGLTEPQVHVAEERTSDKLVR